jgi:hypothetical protein
MRDSVVRPTEDIRMLPFKVSYGALVLLVKPRVNDWHRESFKLDQVASCQSGMARHHNAGDHGVAKINWPKIAR